MVFQTTKPATSIVTDEWVAIDWEAFKQLIEQPECQNWKAYYHNHRMKLETMPVGSDHAQTQALLIFIIGLYAMLHGITLSPKDNCSFRKTGLSECQPDIAYYIGDNAKQIPQGTRIIDLDQHPQPDLVIEVADTTFKDDIGEKRLQYEELGVAEYWVWDVQNQHILAFAIGPDCSSRRIRTSIVLPDLALDLIEAAIHRSWTSDQSAVGTWLMQKWQSSDAS